MKININFNYKVKNRILNENWVKLISPQIITTALQQQDKLNTKNIKQVFINLYIVTEKDIQTINKKYRKKNKITDVLSFPKYSAQELNKLKTKIIELGDIIICEQRLLEQAQEYNHSSQREYAFLLTHGCLHLLSYDHITPELETEMFNLQENILNTLNITRN